MAGGAMRGTLGGQVDARVERRPQTDCGVAVPVDGELYRNSWHVAVVEYRVAEGLARMAGRQEGTALVEEARRHRLGDCRCTADVCR